jgi:hypothetical protein
MMFLIAFTITFIMAFVCTTYLIIRCVDSSKSFDEFITKVLNLVYSLVIIVFSFFLIFGDQAALVTVFASTVMFFILRFNLQDTYDDIKILLKNHR